MEDKNFDSLKNLKAPDKWIENALNIEKVHANVQAQEKKPVFFIRYSRQLAAVACLVLVCTISLFVALNKGDNNVLVVDPNSGNTQTEKNDVNGNETENSSDVKKPDNKKDKNKKPHSIIESILNNLNGGAPHEGTENEESTQKPTHPQNEDSHKPTQKPATGPTKPSQGEVEPTDTPENTTPVVKPTTPHAPPATQAPPTQKPTKPSTPGKPQAPGSTPDPDDPNTGGAPATPPETPPVDSDFSAIVDRYYLTSEKTLYCAVLAPDGSTLVSDVPAELYPYGNSAIATYTLDKHQITQTGQYTCFFYTFDYYVCTTYLYIG